MHAISEKECLEPYQSPPRNNCPFFYLALVFSTFSYSSTKEMNRLPLDFVRDPKKHFRPVGETPADASDDRLKGGR